MNEAATISAAILLGLMSSSHCVAMCGGLMSAFNIQKNNAYLSIILFNCGRLISYVIVGALVGMLSQSLQSTFQEFSLLLRMFAGLLLIAMGLYLANWWNGLQLLEKLAYPIWRPIQARLKKLFPLQKLSHSFIVGLFWGWIPCGLIYSVLSWSATQDYWYQSAGIMFFFGIGTLPAVLISSTFITTLKGIIRHHWFRSFAAGSLLLFGIWTISTSIYYNYQHNEHATHNHHVVHNN